VKKRTCDREMHCEPRGAKRMTLGFESAARVDDILSSVLVKLSESKYHQS
jgi:hypothetical protein